MAESGLVEKQNPDEEDFPELDEADLLRASQAIEEEQNVLSNDIGYTKPSSSPLKFPQSLGNLEPGMLSHGKVSSELSPEIAKPAVSAQGQKYVNAFPEITAIPEPTVATQKSTSMFFPNFQR